MMEFGKIWLKTLVGMVLFSILVCMLIILVYTLIAFVVNFPMTTISLLFLGLVTVISADI